MGGTATTASEPWFKFYAADYLLDSGIDSLPLDARATLLAMWCVCHIDGFCPSVAEEVARKTRLPLQAIEKHREQLVKFFELRDGNLYSRRMEEEKRKSDVARRNGQKRGDQIRSANRSASSSADCLAQSQSQSQSQSQNLSPFSQEGVDLLLQKKKSFSQSDFDERDFRKFAEARKKFEHMMAASFGSGCTWTEEQIILFECQQADITPARWHELEETRKSWAEGASA